MSKQNQVDMAGLDLIVRSIRVGAEKPGDLGTEVTLPEAPPQVDPESRSSLEDVKEKSPGMLSRVFKTK
jgi:hypothetical protein